MSNKITVKAVSQNVTGRHAFEDRVKELGYSLSQGEILEAFEKFRSL